MRPHCGKEEEAEVGIIDAPSVVDHSDSNANSKGQRSMMAEIAQRTGTGSKDHIAIEGKTNGKKKGTGLYRISGLPRAGSWLLRDEWLHPADSSRLGCGWCFHLL